MAIDLPSFHESKPSARHVVELPYPLSDDLDKYLVLYNETYKAHVTASDLIREIIRLHLDRDQNFREKKASHLSLKRNRSRHPTTTPTTAMPLNAASASS